MKLSKHQQELLLVLKTTVKRKASNEIVYKSEWLGYLPFGQYHWLEIDGEELKLNTHESLLEDLSHLNILGLLERVKDVQVNDEDLHIYYELQDL